MFDLKRNFIFYYLLVALVFLYAIYQAYHWRWICDDAYISFVYARNLWEGNGLVFNLGEKVEGYTNFLWTLYLSFGYFVGIKPQLLSVFTGIFFYILLLCLFFDAENKISFGNVYPLLIVHLAFIFHLYIFASSGLETSLFTFFLSWGLLLWEKQNKRVFVVFLITSLFRPEGALFLVFASLDWIRKKQYKEPIFFGVLFLFFCGLRFFYYEDFFPNTFYAKGNKGRYFSQGFYYLLYFLKSYPLFPFVILLTGIQIFHIFQTKRENWLLVHSILLYIIYVLYVGGDFMGNRFWIPILPFVSYLAFQRIQFWTTESQIASNQKSRFYQIYAKNSILFGLLFLLSSAIYTDPLKSDGKRVPDWHGIGEERMFYEQHLMDESGYDDGALEKFRVAFFGAQAHFIYYLRPNFSFEAESGLTDKLFAKKQIDVRGRVGHETKLSYDDLNSRKIDLLLDNRLPELDLPFVTYTWRSLPLKFYIWNYDPIKMNPLCQRKDWNCEDLKKRFLSQGLDLNQTVFFGKNDSK